MEVETLGLKDDELPISKEDGDEKRAATAKNRLFRGGMGIGRDNPDALSTKEENAYRLTREDQIIDIEESGYVRPKKGKLKGGHKGEVFWSEGSEKLFYLESCGGFVLEINKEKVDGTIRAASIKDLKAIWRFDEEEGLWKNLLPGVLERYYNEL